MEELRDLLDLETSSKDIHVREDEKGNTGVLYCYWSVETETMWQGKMSTLITRVWRERRPHFGPPKFHRADINPSRICSGSLISCLLWDIVYAWQKRWDEDQHCTKCWIYSVRKHSSHYCSFSVWHEIHSHAEFKIKEYFAIIEKEDKKNEKKKSEIHKGWKVS